MHVLKFSDVYFPRINGVSTSILTFRRALAELGVRVTVVAPEYQDEAPANDVIRVAARRVPLDPEDRLMRGSALRQLPGRLHGLGLNLVHVQTPFAAHYTGVKVARSLGVPCIATYHTHFEEYLFHYIPLLPRASLRALARRVARGQCAALDAVVVPSQAMAETLRDYGVTRPLHVIPTGLGESEFVRGDGQSFRATHNIGRERKLALYVGRVAFEKNIGFLLEVAQLARRQRPDLLLLIAGDGPALPSLRRKSEQMGLTDHVRFVGYLARDTGLKDCYASADLFVFASHTETQGLVLLEAMAAGLPVLAIPALGAAGIVSPQRGAVPGSREVPAFAEQLVQLLDQPQRLAQLGEDAVEFAREWDAASQAIKLAALYRSLIEQHPGQPS
jgi:1,2-diacylglycerol 3-alpha-glucosyltransferase